MYLTDSQVKRFEGTASEKEWNSLCDIILDSNNGKYPDNWYEKIVLSGLVDRKQQEFSKKI